MKVVLFGGDRYSTRRILEIMIRKELEIVGCVMESAWSSHLSPLCEQKGIPVYTDMELYRALEEGNFPQFDVGISYLYHKILKEPIINFANHNIINFHSSPIQVHRGIASCCYCLLKEYKEWAVTAHYLVSSIDEGDIIMERWFSIEGLTSAVETEACIQKHLEKLFEEIITILLGEGKLPRKKQDLSKGNYFSRKDLEREKMVKMTDSTEQIDKKIDALWLPPYHGAYIEINGQKYTLVHEKLLKSIAELYQQIRDKDCELN